MASGHDALVSVIVPVRNRRGLLLQTLRALANQTMPDFEAIIVDDGSTDGSLEAVHAMAEVDPRFQVIRGESTGAVAARRAGVAIARSPHLAFTDSDCIPAEDWLATGLHRLQRGIDLVKGITYPQEPVRPLQRSLWSDFDDGLYPTCNLFVRRTAYEAAGGFPLELGRQLGFRGDPRSERLGIGEDTVFGWEVRRRGMVAFAPEVRVAHHVFPVDVSESLRRAWSVGAFPGLVRRVPELRQTLLVDRIFLGGRSRLPLYLSMLVSLSGRRMLPFAAVACWVGARYTRLSHAEPSVRRRLKVLPVDLVCDGLSACALVLGSARSRRLVL